MDFIISNQKRMSVKLQRLLMIMVAIIVASMTITACWDDENDEDGEENGNGGGGVAGKRIKKWEQTTGPTDEVIRYEVTYSSNGYRSDGYNAQSKFSGALVYICNSDGLINKVEGYDSGNKLGQVTTYSYDSNKKPVKAQSVTIINGVEYNAFTIDYTFQNGRKIREVIKNEYAEIKYEYNYDSKGKRTTMTETNSTAGTRQVTYTYNSDGTWQKVTYPKGYNGSDNTIVTWEYTWENGKTTHSYQNAEDLFMY